MSGVINHLSMVLLKQFDRLSDNTLEGDDLKAEIERSRAMSEISEQALDTGRLALQAARFVDTSMSANPKTASFCKQDGEWLDPKEYRSTIYEMGCKV